MTESEHESGAMDIHRIRVRYANNDDLMLWRVRVLVVGWEGKVYVLKMLQSKLR